MIANVREERIEDGRISIITIDRQDKLNAMTMTMRAQVGHAIEAAGADDTVRVIVVKGAGDKAFSAGGDIAGFMEVEPPELVNLRHFMSAPERAPKPVIASITGYCFGAGLELVLTCDFRIASTTAEFALPEIKLGMIPGSGGSQRIIRLCGMTRAKAMIMTGQRVPAPQAEQWGLISQMVEVDQLESATLGLARQLAAYSPLALRTLKQVMNVGAELPLEGATALEGQAYGMLRSSADFAEGVAAYIEKRPPEFTGR